MWVGCVELSPEFYFYLLRKKTRCPKIIGVRLILVLGKAVVVVLVLILVGGCGYQNFRLFIIFSHYRAMKRLEYKIMIEDLFSRSLITPLKLVGAFGIDSLIILRYRSQLHLNLASAEGDAARA